MFKFESRNFGKRIRSKEGRKEARREGEQKEGRKKGRKDWMEG